MTKNARTLAALALLLLSLCAPHTATAQERTERFDFYTRGPYRAQVPRPQTLLRYDVGDFHTNYAMMERVIGAIAQAAPDRVRVFDIGLTNEYRMQHVVAVSSPENIARLDEIKSNLKRLSDPRGLPEAEARRLASTTPVALWLQYTIHGNESASFEAMMQVALPARGVGRARDARRPEEQRRPHQRLRQPGRPRALRHLVQLLRRRRPRALGGRARRAVVGLRPRQPLPLRPQPRQHRHLAGRDAQHAARLPRMEPAGRRRPPRPALAVLLPAGGACPSTRTCRPSRPSAG